jgi:hypothetical protein
VLNQSRHSPAISAHRILSFFHLLFFLSPSARSDSHPSEAAGLKMKGALVTAAALLGSAQAGGHKLKLKKIPLSEQLVGFRCAS